MNEDTTRLMTVGDPAARPHKYTMKDLNRYRNLRKAISDMGLDDEYSIEDYDGNSVAFRVSPRLRTFLVQWGYLPF